MTRTSLTHPILIAEVRAQPDHGRIGITFCPGKKDRNAMSGAWDRDLKLDLDAIKAWGAVVVITLIEDHEFELLHVKDLEGEVRQRHMEWMHLPIEDVSVPGAGFETTWAARSEGIRARLRDGFDVLVHCRGGLGRAGTIAARLLTELGVPAREAIAQVRQVRPGAIETMQQEKYVLRQSALGERMPECTDEAIRDRAIGALLGLAVGDAIGTTLEFKRRDTYEPLSDMVGGGPFGLKPGEWTDDTAMAIALADSLSACGDLNEADLQQRFYNWYSNGAYSCTGRCFDIGITTRQALERWKSSRLAHAGSTDPTTAGNGSLMRLAPIAIRYWRDRTKLRDAAARQSKTTHGAPESVDACVAFAQMLADAIEGAPRSEVLRSRTDGYADAISRIVQGSWRKRRRDTIRSSGYVAHSLEASLWSVARSGDYREAVLTAANLGDDADTTAAITGQLAGALYGASGIPKSFVSRVAWSNVIIEQAACL